MIERILVGTDGSQAAQSALASALRIARATEARVRGVHVLDRPSLYAPAPGFDPRLVELREETAAELLVRFRQRAGEADVPVDTVQREGRPGETILEEAAQWGADLVALGTHGRGRVARAIVGSVADQLVRQSPTPVLTARPPAASKPQDPIDRILVPSDGSPAALEAAAFALDLVQAGDVQVDLLHAIAPELEGGKYLDRPASEVDEVHERMVAQALDPLEARCSEAGLDCERLVVHAAPHRAIVDHAEARSADLVVMATHGRGALERFLLGSVTDKVLRSARTPVVTVRPQVSRDD